MAHKYPNILIHLVFSTKDRAKLIPNELLPRLAKYLAGIGRNHGVPVLAAGGTSNHSHLLIVLPSDMTLAKAVQVLKANSSRWVREHGIAFTWQEGPGFPIPCLRHWIWEWGHHLGREISSGLCGDEEGSIFYRFAQVVVC